MINFSLFKVEIANVEVRYKTLPLSYPQRETGTKADDAYMIQISEHIPPVTTLASPDNSRQFTVGTKVQFSALCYFVHSFNSTNKLYKESHLG